MSLLEFARGPALVFALVVFFAGIAWRLYGIFRRPKKPDLSAPRSDALFAGAVLGILRRMWHPATLRRRSLASTINGYGYHLGLAIVFFGFAPHIAFVERLTGLAWPSVPSWVFVLGVAATFAGLGIALLMRLTSPVLRLISNYDDYVSWAVTMLPMLTGMAVMVLPFDATYPAVPERPAAVALHLISLELLLVWLPFGKLSHAWLFALSRGVTGAAFTRKGAAP